MVDILNAEMNGGSEAPPVQDGDLSSLFDSPDLASFIKVAKTSTAREYEAKMKALLKAGMVGAINNGNLPDAAAFLYHGPAFASATGQLAEQDERVRKAIDLIASPANPMGMFVMTAIPLISQLFRNHEAQVKAVPEVLRTRKQRKAQRKAEAAAQPKAEIKLPFGKTVKLGLRLRFPAGKFFAGFKAQTTEPNELAFKVFSNPKVRRELAKQGVEFRDQ